MDGSDPRTRAADSVKRTRLKPISNKRRTQLRDYYILRKDFLRQNPVCEICKRNKPWDVHHQKGRNGRLLLNDFYWLAVCRGCHDLIHEHPAWAREQGYIIR